VLHSEPASTGTSNVASYSCNAWLEPGPERVHTVVAPTDGTLEVTISNFTGDLDVFVLSACDTLACVAVGDVTASLTAVAGQMYYIVVDGFDGSGGSYDILVDCPEPVGFSCTDAVPLTCGVLHSEPASTEASDVGSYSCNTWNDAGDVSATLTTAVAGQTYYIVVDGFDGSGGAYDILVDCTAPEVFTCDNAVPLACGVLHSEPASTASSTVASYTCNGWGEPGPERVHTVTVSADGTLEATISNFTGDLDVFILSDCDPATCVAAGDLTASLTTAVAGQSYYIVVDGYDGSGSAYDILVSCPEVAGCVVIDMHAADSIRLNGGFTVELGAEVYIHIEDCQ